MQHPYHEQADLERAPAPGAASSRTPETEARYLRRALLFEAHTAHCISIANPGPEVVAAYALEKRDEWAKSTWRQIKASLLFRFEAMGTPEATAAADLLRDGSQTPCATKTRRTSARRAKSVSREDFEVVIRQVRSSRSEYASMLCSWLILGAEIGLRPHEWCQATLVRAFPRDVGDTGVQSDEPLPYLCVSNGKRTNGRSHGKLRHLNLQRLAPELVSQVGEFAAAMQDIASAGLYDKCYRGCTKLLYRINRELHSNDSDKWVQLYSSRHRFSSEAKRALDRSEVAALMGHATTKTAGEHYGRRVASSGTLGPLPVAAEIARVRKVRTNRARSGTQSMAPSPATGAKSAT